MPSRGEALDIPHAREQRGAGQESHARDLAQLSRALIGAREGCELALNAQDLLLERGDLLGASGRVQVEGPPEGPSPFAPTRG